MTEMMNPRARMQRAKLFLIEFLRMGLFSIVAIAFIRYFLFKPFYVRGASMEPNFQESEYLIIDEVTYRLREPVRSDIIVFRFPGSRREYFLKRIIGLPGETVKIKDGRVTVFNAERPQGFVLDESPYLSASVITAGDLTVVLGTREYFVMGDNRNASWDSRGFGPISRSLIVGRAVLRGFPINRFEILAK